jgi:taurine dioxygenase
MSYDLRPLAGGFGARVICDLGNPPEGKLAQELLRELRRYRFLVFPGQHLNHADLLRAAAVFGPVDTDVDHAYEVPGFPGITVISNIFDNGRPIGIYDGDHEEEWHADNSFKPRLTTATVLYSVIAPAEGGETRLADATRAYDDLPSELKEEINPLQAVHSIARLGARQAEAASGRSSAADGALATAPEVDHPLVTVHPATLRSSLLLGSMVLEDIVGMDPAKSEALLSRLLAWTTQDRYVYRHTWSAGDLLVWDNLAVLHTASPCDHTREHRLLYRVALS